MNKESELLIDSEEVEKAFLNCLYKPDELESGESVPTGAVTAEGITGNYSFHPDRLEEQRAQVEIWLKALPKQFRKSEGGGWSFLKADQQDNGVQWTGLHQRMEQLFTLAMGLGLANFNFPRSMWGNLTGNMPYYYITV